MLKHAAHVNCQINDHYPPIQSSDAPPATKPTHAPNAALAQLNPPAGAYNDAPVMLVFHPLKTAAPTFPVLPHLAAHPVLCGFSSIIYLATTMPSARKKHPNACYLTQKEIALDWLPVSLGPLNRSKLVRANHELIHPAACVKHCLKNGGRPALNSLIKRAS